jgi:ligand-binding sensor domain-containing protein
MKNALTCTQTLLFPFLGICLSFTSCNGQVKKDLPQASNTEQKIALVGQTKMIKNHFTNQNQAIADNVHCGLQDKAGNLWFGTTGDGVYRYDGQTFTNFTTKKRAH